MLIPSARLVPSPAPTILTGPQVSLSPCPVPRSPNHASQQVPASPPSLPGPSPSLPAGPQVAPHPSQVPPPSLPASPQVPPSLTCWLQDSGSPAAEPGPAFQGAPGLAPPREGRPRPAPAAPRSTPGAPGRLLRGGPGVQGGTRVCTDTHTHTHTCMHIHTLD